MLLGLCSFNCSKRGDIFLIRNSPLGTVALMLLPLSWCLNWSLSSFWQQPWYWWDYGTEPERIHVLGYCRCGCSARPTVCNFKCTYCWWWTHWKYIIFHDKMTELRSRGTFNMAASSHRLFFKNMLIYSSFVVVNHQPRPALKANRAICVNMCLSLNMDTSEPRSLLHFKLREPLFSPTSNRNVKNTRVNTSVLSFLLQ